jgi:hypothetical protein
MISWRRRLVDKTAASPINRTDPLGVSCCPQAVISEKATRSQDMREFKYCEFKY